MFHTNSVSNFQPADNTSIISPLLDNVNKYVNNESYQFDKIHVSGFEEDIIQKLKSTVVMQKVLRNMCTRPNKHGLYDGWGTLEPWPTLNNPYKLYKLITECTTNTEDIEWRGRNF